MSNKLVDICVNLTDDVFAGKEKNIIDAANKNNVAKMVLVGNDLDSSLKVSSLAEQFSFVATAGYHPHNAKDWNEKSYDSLLSILKKNHVKAVGECGLDFNRNFSTPEIQNSVFLNHIDLAKETNESMAMLMLLKDHVQEIR